MKGSLVFTSLLLAGLTESFGGRGYGGYGGGFGGDGINWTYVTVTVTPTVTEAVFDVRTSTVQTVETRTLTQLNNIDVINTEYARFTVNLQQGITRRRTQTVRIPDSTTAIRSTNIQVSVSTEVIPVASTVQFTSTGTAFVTQTQNTLINSVVQHTKCDDVEIVTVLSFVNVVLTETAIVVSTTYITSTITATSVVATSEPATRYTY